MGQICHIVAITALTLPLAAAFAPNPTKMVAFSPRVSSSSLNLFDKMFEEAGPLGKGITVGKVQIALSSTDRGGNSIFSLLAKAASEGGSSDPSELANLTNAVCLGLLRKSDDWIGACSDSKWFKWDDSGQAESLYNEWANREAAKFEKEYIPQPGAVDEEDAGAPGGATTVIVSIIIEIQGDETNFDGAGFSIAGTKEVISAIASDCKVDGGECLNAVEVFWTPSDSKEVLTRGDIIVDFPEIIDL